MARKFSLLALRTKRTLPRSSFDRTLAGAEVLGEGIVFGIAAFVLIVENRRAAANEVCTGDSVVEISL